MGNGAAHVAPDHAALMVLLSTHEAHEQMRGRRLATFCTPRHRDRRRREICRNRDE